MKALHENRTEAQKAYRLADIKLDVIDFVILAYLVSVIAFGIWVGVFK